ncbi:hypothetical protein VUR80DRAFT_4124 [Thermomyces stellatus]
MTSPAQATSPPANTESPNPPASSPPRQQPEEEAREPVDARLPPLFTLVQNSTSKTTHHPHVHYIFADDDPELLTRALTASDPAAPGGAEATRSVLLDLAPGDDGWQVSHASSLSADWAVVDAGLRTMEDAEGQEGGTGALMLRIEGVEGESGDVEASEGARDGKEEYEVLMEEFEKRMGVLRRVVGAGEARRRVCLQGRPENEGPPESGERTAEEQQTQEAAEKGKGPERTDEQAQSRNPVGD